MKKICNFINHLGPDILLASAAICTSHLIQSTRAGAYFGLALSDKFTLSNVENHFAKDNADYDYASGSSNLLHTVLTSYLGKDDWSANLLKFINNELGTQIPTKVKELLFRHHGVAVKMDEFYKAIQRDKSTPFPSGNLKELLPQNMRGNH